MSWYIAEVLPRGFFLTLCDEEKTLRPVAERALEQLGFNFCLLTDKTLELIRNRKETILRPRLYRYLFIQGGSPGTLCASRVPGFSGLLKNADGDYAVVTDDDIAHLKEPEQHKPQFASIPIGTHVRVVSGPAASESRIGRVTDAKPQQQKAQIDFGCSGLVWLSMDVLEGI